MLSVLQPSPFMYMYRYFVRASDLGVGSCMCGEEVGSTRMQMLHGMHASTIYDVLVILLDDCMYAQLIGSLLPFQIQIATNIT